MFEILYTMVLVIATVFIGGRMIMEDPNKEIEHLSINEKEGFRF